MKKTMRLSLILLLITITLLGCQPEKKRNESSSDIKMIVDLQDVDNRTPIIRTYKKEEFINFEKEEIQDIKDKVNGNIEGDIPALVLENGTGKIEILFEDDSTSARLNPDDVPKIKISALDSIYSEEEPNEINDLLIKSEQEEKYMYEIKRYLNDEEITFEEDEDFFTESMFIEIDYKIENENYVSIFAINTIEYK